MTIKLNGDTFNTNLKSAFMLRNTYFDKSCIIIVNGFQISKDIMISENDEVFIIKKGVMPKKNHLEAMMAARHTPYIHEKLKNSSVAIAGLGGLGSNIAVSLARIGIGELLLVDYDIVEPSNLNRQSYYISHLGMLKTEALREQLKQINPFINIIIKSEKINEKNAVSIFNNYAIVCEAFDNPEAKAMLVSTLLSELPDIKIVAASGMAGYDSSNKITTKLKMKNLYLCGDEENDAKINRGLMAPRVQICAGHQANMVLRLILGIEEV